MCFVTAVLFELCWFEIRDSWEDGNPGSWGASPQYQVSNQCI